MERQVSISESEWRVMEVLWADAPLTLAEILDRLNGSGWSQTTIQTYLARLVKKGALQTERRGKGYLYTPTLPEAECRLAQGRSFLGRVYDGSLSSMVAGFIKGGDVSREELEALKKLIDAQEKGDEHAGDR